MNITKDKITEIFYITDEFCKNFKNSIEAHLIGNKPKKQPIMTESEVITLMILFHMGSFRTLKDFYICYVKGHLKSEFPNTVSYNRFTELMQNAVLPMTIMMKTCCLGECTGISFIDSTPIRVCKNKRIKRNKVFKGIAELGKSTMGYFYGFKLHLIVNDKGEILNFIITQANVDDRQPLRIESFIHCIKGKLYGDKGYLSKELTNLLFVDGLHLVTTLRNNMKNCLMELKDKIMLRKRSVIETINDELKNMCQIEHSRHRSFGNFISNMIAGLIAYSFFPKKPSIKYENIQSDQLQLFF
jgi:hypothetical protein